MRMTSKIISKAIKDKYGIDGVMVHRGGGMCSFYSDTNEEASSVILSGDNGVCVYRLNHLSLEEWLESFYQLWQDNAPTRLKLTTNK